MPQLPTPLRAAVGLAAEAVDQARHLPDRAIELPMLAVSTALQLSLRAQQRYAMLAARGDELLNHQEPTDEPPPWATFDDPISDAPDGGPTLTAVDGGAADAQQPGEPAATGRAKRANTSAPKANGGAAPRKTVRRPRNAAPSRFDTVGDE